ncbi:MAG: hypothetical protein NTY98_02720 [Verrucomicrobia bacterium]|nr:hypothetical protein [Verrucomicrobiota bacterium]
MAAAFRFTHETVNFEPMMSLDADLRAPRAGAWVCLLLACAVLFPVQAGAQRVRADTGRVEHSFLDIHSLVSSGHWEIRMPDGPSWEMIQKAMAEHNRQRFKILRTRPGLGPLLVEQAESDLADPNFSSYLPGLFHAMTLRKDVDPQAIRSFIQKARGVIESPPKELQEADYHLLLGIPELLALHATPENEDLLVKLMKLGETNFDVYSVSEAAKVLAKTGSARCLPAMEEALQWLQQRREDVLSKEAVAPLQSCLKQLRARVAAAGGRKEAQHAKK